MKKKQRNKSGPGAICGSTRSEIGTKNTKWLTGFGERGALSLGGGKVGEMTHQDIRRYFG